MNVLSLASSFASGLNISHAPHMTTLHRNQPSRKDSTTGHSDGGSRGVHGPNYLYELPAELLLEVLEKMSVREIIEFSLTTKGARDFALYHKRFLRNRLEEIEVKRLQHTIDSLNIQGKSYLNALRTFLSIFGIPFQAQAYARRRNPDLAVIFARYFCDTNFTSSMAVQERRIRSVTVLTREVLRLNNAIHGRCGWPKLDPQGGDGVLPDRFALILQHQEASLPEQSPPEDIFRSLQAQELEGTVHQPLNHLAEEDMVDAQTRFQHVDCQEYLPSPELGFAWPMDNTRMLIAEWCKREVPEPLAMLLRGHSRTEDLFYKSHQTLPRTPLQMRESRITQGVGLVHISGEQGWQMMEIVFQGQ
ncbi:hypothetical protein LTR66_004309 [Elasticomyces elasticus]|nr:hypothetical protein LTR66_004309 [Elasticomyces elasticus]